MTIRPRFTYANVMSTFAVFLALSGATAVAANSLAKNSVGTKQLRKNAVTSVDIKKSAVTNAKIKNGAVTGAKIKNATITGDKLNLSTLGVVPVAAGLTGFSRGGAIRAAATSGADEAAARAAAPEQPLGTAGPFTVYGKCMEYAGTVRAEAYIRTTLGGAVFDSDEDNLTGDPFLEPDTAEDARQLMYTSNNSANSASFYGVHSSEFVALATDGTAFRGDISVAAKNGDLPGSQGVYGSGSSCLFTSTTLKLNP